MKRQELPIPADFRARWKSRFEYRATTLDDDAGIAGWSPSGLETRFRSFRRYFRPHGPVGLWLDIGCGAGTYTRFLDDQGLRAIGIDYSLPSLAKAQHRSPARIHWLAADATRLPLRPRTVDGVLCLGVLQAIPSSGPALEAIANVLKPGGALWIDFLNAHFLPTRLALRRRRSAGMPAHLRYETRDEVVEAMRERGFEIVSVHWIPILPARLRWLQRIVDTTPLRSLLGWVRPLAESASHSVLLHAIRAAARSDRP